jgi:hypothetical protein
MTPHGGAEWVDSWLVVPEQPVANEGFKVRLLGSVLPQPDKLRGFLLHSNFTGGCSEGSVAEAAATASATCFGTSTWQACGFDQGLPDTGLYRLCVCHSPAGPGGSCTEYLSFHDGVSVVAAGAAGTLLRPDAATGATTSASSSWATALVTIALVTSVCFTCWIWFRCQTRRRHVQTSAPEPKPTEVRRVWVIGRGKGSNGENSPVSKKGNGDGENSPVSSHSFTSDVSTQPPTPTSDPRRFSHASTESDGSMDLSPCFLRHGAFWNSAKLRKIASAGDLEAAAEARSPQISPRDEPASPSFCLPKRSRLGFQVAASPSSPYSDASPVSSFSLGSGSGT